MQRVKLLFVTLILSATVNSQALKKEQVIVQQTIEKMFATLSTFDTLALKGFLTSNVRFYEYGQVWTIDTLIQKVLPAKSIPGFKRINKFQFLSTRIHHQTAWVTYYLQSTITRDKIEETLNWIETVILVKGKKEWKIEVLHSTRLNKK